jgi:hypothetical protein
MHIKNKFLRFIASVFITLILYFLLAMGISQGEIADAIEAMFIFAIFGLFIVVPTLVFFAYTTYYLLTQKSERSKRAARIIKIMMVFLMIMALLYAAAQFTDLLDNLF